MIKTFTRNDLIRYIYHETSETEEQEINKALLTDSELRAAYQSLLATKKELDQATLQPASTTVLNILSYSRSTSNVKH